MMVLRSDKYTSSRISEDGGSMFLRNITMISTDMPHTQTAIHRIRYCKRFSVGSAPAMMACNNGRAVGGGVSYWVHAEAL
jgi:hypothetical protein